MKQHDHYQFWRRDDLWPPALGYVFLASVVQQIGKALFGDEWLESDPYAELYRDPRPGETYSLADRYELPTSSNPQGGRPLKLNPTDAERAANRAAVERLETIRRYISDAGLTGKLVFGTRPVAGGAVVPLPPIVWQSENIRWRFYFCKIDPLNPYGNAFDGDGLHYLFITAESLKRFLEDVQRRAASEKAPSAHITGEAACEQWLTAEVKESPYRPSKPRDEYKREALLRFKGLSTNGFTRAWAAATKNSALDDNGRRFWNKGGPRTRRA